MDNSTTSLVGRQAERQQLDQLVQGTGDDPRCVAVVGPSGVGKTRLLDEAESLANEAGLVVVRGTCLDLGESWPLHPLIEAVQRLQNDAPEVAARLREVTDPTSDNNGNLLGQVHTRLTDLADEHRLMVILDDLQWADRTTQRLVATLLSGLTPQRILVVLASRTANPGGDEPMAVLSSFEQSQMMNLIELEPFTAEQTKELATDIVKRPLSDAEVYRLWRRSGGLPVLIVELITHSQDEISPYVFQLNQRIEALPDDTRRFLQVVSLAGRPIQHDLVRDALQADDDQTLQAARQAVAAGVIINSEGGYAPLHDLFREKATELLLTKERQLLHRRIAETMEARLEAGGSGAAKGDAAVEEVELAHHWANAGANERALRPLIQAAVDAGDKGAAEEAWRHWQTVVVLLESPPEWADTASLQHRAAEAAFATQRYDDALRLINHAVLVCEANGSAGITNIDLQVAKARYLKAAGSPAIAAELCQRILADDDIPVGRLADVAALLSDINVQLGRYGEACVQAERALQLATQGHEDYALLAAASLGYATACLGDPDQGRQRLQDAFDQAHQSDRPELIEAAGRHYVELLMGPLNQIDEGVGVAQATASELLERGVDSRLVTSLLAAATKGLFRLGRWNEANKYATAALQSDPTGANVIELLLARARVVMGLGDFDTADRDLDAVAALMGRQPNPARYLPYATLRIGAAWWETDIEEARNHVDLALDVVEQTEFDDHWVLAPLIWHGFRAEAQAVRTKVNADPARVDRLKAASNLLFKSSGQLDADESRLLEAYQLLCNAELSWINGEADTALWNRAAEAWSACGHPYPAAYARLQMAEIMFGQRTRNRRAKEALISAYDTVCELSAEPLKQSIEDLAVRARVNLDNAPRSQRLAIEASDSSLSVLTNREREVLACVARGLSNREVGEELFISSRTAGVHVSNILAKLGVRSRVEAASVYLADASSV